MEAESIHVWRCPPPYGASQATGHSVRRAESEKRHAFARGDMGLARYLCKHCVELAEVVVLALLRFGAELGGDLVNKGPLRVLLARDWILGLVARRRHERALRCALREAGRALVAALEPDGVSVHRRC